MTSLARRHNHLEDDDHRFRDDEDADDFVPCRILSGTFSSYLKSTEQQPPAGEHRLHTNCPTPIDEQIASLARLEDDWYDHSSRKYASDELHWVERLLVSIVDVCALPTPYIYPTPEGLVRVEWSATSSEVIVNIDLSEQSAEAIAFRVGSDSIEELSVAFSNADSALQLGRFIGNWVVERTAE